MESSIKIREWMNSLTDTIAEQAWFQELKGKWEDLDPQSKLNLKLGGVGIGALAVLMLLFSSIWGVQRLKGEVNDKRNLLSMIQNANDEIRRLKDSVPASSSSSSGSDRESPGGSWSSYFEGLTANAGMDKASLTVSTEKAGPATDQSKELMYELSIKHVNLKNVVRLAYALENGTKPVKVRNLLIDTKGDPTGYLDATLEISAFALVTPQ